MCAAAIAALPGKAASKGAMRVYYGTGDKRRSERDTQLDVRQRLIHTVRAVIEAVPGGWTRMPRGPADLALLAPSRQ